MKMKDGTDRVAVVLKAGILDQDYDRRDWWKQFSRRIKRDFTPEENAAVKTYFSAPPSPAHRPVTVEALESAIRRARA